MFKKSKLLVILLALALIPATASATMTRVIGFGGENAGFVIKDASNPALFPSTLVYYPHLLFAEFVPGAGSTSLDRVGAWYGFGENKCVLAFDIFKRSLPDYSGMPELADELGMSSRLPYRLNLRWAKPFGNVAVGAALGLYHESRTNKTADGKKDSLEQKNTIIGLDLGLTALDNLLDVSLGFEMPSWTNKDTGKTVSENDGSMLIKFAGRYWYYYGDKTTLIPNLEFQMKTDAYKKPNPDGNASTADDRNYSTGTTAFRLGLGHNWKPADNVLVLFDFGVQFLSMKYENKHQRPGMPDTTYEGTNSTQYLPYWRCGWEGGVFKWLKIRAGAEKLWANVKAETIAEEPEAGATVTNMYFGGDFYFGPVVIQYLLDQGFVARGPYFISGAGGAMFHRFSLFYAIPK